MTKPAPVASDAAAGFREQIVTAIRATAKVGLVPISRDHVRSGITNVDEIADAILALSAPPVHAEEGERFYAVKAAIEHAMQDERDGKPCGCIIEAGCEARGYDDPSYAASGFIWQAAEAAILAGLSHPSSGEGVEGLLLRASAQIKLGQRTGADGGGTSPHNIYVIAAELLAALSNRRKS